MTTETGHKVEDSVGQDWKERVDTAYSRCPRWAARWSGRCPVSLVTLASAPTASSRLMTAGTPRAHASYRMDAPSLAWEDTLAPRAERQAVCVCASACPPVRVPACLTCLQQGADWVCVLLLSSHISACLSDSLYVCLFVYLSVCLSVCLCVCLRVCPSHLSPGGC